MDGQNRLQKLPAKTTAGLQWVSRGMGVVAAAVLAFMMLLTVADVIGRYFFSRPIKGTWELVGLLLVCAGTWGLAYCQIEKAHISITIMYDLFSRRVRAGMSAFACLIGLGGFSFISWQTFVLAKKYFLLPKMDETDTLGLPFSPFILLLSIGAGMMALILVVDVVRYIAEVTRK
ncbi:MAG: TRAP transporter small permease [Planctomycetota bacterium]|nr:MAG: TRAP transporter small permease [Planctomycetota bacterium]